MNKILIFLALLSFCAHAQIIEVEYNCTLIDEKDDYGDIKIEKLILQTSNSESLLKRTERDTIFETITKGVFESNTSSESVYEIIEYKDLVNKVYFFKAPYIRKTVKDDQYKISWNILSETKTILNYQCQRAICQFRGRDYIVYFTSEIPIPNGPFKFDGLPGLILEVLSLDEMVKIKATSVALKNEHDIKNTFENNKTINWDDFQKEYKKVFNRVVNSMSDLDSEIIIPNRAIEFYITTD